MRTYPDVVCTGTETAVINTNLIFCTEYVKLFGTDILYTYFFAF